MSQTQRGTAVVSVVTALLAGVAGVVGSYALAGYSESFVAAPVAASVTQNAPGFLLQFAIGPLTTIGEGFGIEHLGQQANLVLAVGLAVVLFAVLTVSGLATGRRFANRFVAVGVAGVLVWVATTVLTGAPVTALGAGVGSAIVVALAALVDTTDDANTPVSGGRRSVLGSVAGVFGVGVLGYLLGSRGGSGADQAASSVGGDNESVGAVGGANASGGNAGGGGNRSSGNESGGGSGENSGPAVGRLLSRAESMSLAIDGLEGLVSGDDFYEVDIDNINPDVSAGDWSLSITGAVENEREFTYDDIRGMDSRNRFKSLRCVSDKLNGTSMDNAVWTGVPMQRVLDEAGVQGKFVMARAADDYYEEFPVNALKTGFLAYGMDGEVLPQEHGYPVRALIPGHCGEINVKWITELEILDRPAKGFWEKKGWHGTGPINTVAKLHATNHLDNDRIQVGGHAYAGTRGIEKVEVSTDGGNSWNSAKLSTVLEPNLDGDVWRQWEHTYDSPGSSHDVVVRATDGTGALQPKKSQQPFPSGATGWVSKTIDG